jgi:hypothetical protein
MYTNTRVRDAWECLSVLQQEILSADLAGDDESDDEGIATRFGTTAAAVRVERILARRRLNDALLGRAS